MAMEAADYRKCDLYHLCRGETAFFSDALARLLNDLDESRIHAERNAFPVAALQRRQRHEWLAIPRHDKGFVAEVLDIFCQRPSRVFQFDSFHGPPH